MVFDGMEGVACFGGTDPGVYSVFSSQHADHLQRIRRGVEEGGAKFG